MSNKHNSLQANEICKVDDELGLVFGFAIICKIDGEDYYDVQGDHIPEQSMLNAATDFAMNSGVAKEMHKGDQIGKILFTFPLTDDIAKAFDITTNKTGLMIAMQPHQKSTLEKFKDGTFTGFSIGGDRIQDEPLEE